MNDAATVVLVHGSWIGPDAWDRVRERLADERISTVVVDRRDRAAGGRIVGDLSTNVQLVRQALDRVGGPIVLCGHSAGGSIISRAAHEHPAVCELVYVAGFMTQGTETPLDLGGPPSPAFERALRRVDDDTVAFDPVAARELFFHDLDDDDAAAAVQRLRPQQLGRAHRRIEHGAAWHRCRSTYAVCTEDRALRPSVQRRIARRATRTVEWATGHVPQLARPELVATLLAGLARRIANPRSVP